MKSPRIIVVAGVASGVGKTTVTLGLLEAFRRRGLVVQGFKVGPDFIDPGYHAVATGRPGRSLDAWLSGDDLLPALGASAGDGMDVLIVEGVMGMFDGSGQPGCDGSTAAVARLLDAPVVLVVDVWTMSGSVAAVVHGFRDFDPKVNVGGVILNRVAGPGHAELCREALEPLGIPILGVIEHDDALTWRERHLGLVPVAEHPAEVRVAVERVGEILAASCDLERVMRLARSAPARVVAPLPSAAPSGRIRLALAGGPAFSFTYPENLAVLTQAGAELVPFDPLVDSALPEGCDALYAGGGFPEVFGAALADNRPLLDSVRRALRDGLVAWAECGGLLWLCRSLDGMEMVGALPGDAKMTERLSIGYRTAVTKVGSPFGPAGTALRGYEFHRTVLEPPGTALELEGRFGSELAGHASTTLFASYLHQHLAATPSVAEKFVAAATPGRC